MDHVAVMRKSWGLTEKILSGEKTIESRWYKLRVAPWGRIVRGDVVYFKNSGENVRIRAEVREVVSFADLAPMRVREIIDKYGVDDGISEGDKDYFFNIFKDKKYCLLIFLENPKEIMPFRINKAGFGFMCAWITVPNIESIKI